jgi:hypothetical protein
LCLEESVRRVTGILADKNLPRRYYSEEKLASAAAKQGWLEPDLMSL